MKKITPKILWTLIMIMTLSGALAMGTKLMAKDETPAAAKTIAKAELTLPEVTVNDVDESIDTHYAERTTITYVYYYRVRNGWLQRRKYNRTYGMWVDPVWHNVRKVS